jgi:GR25 family glycosyltransferase involved in LPS biosynthesis
MKISLENIQFKCINLAHRSDKRMWVDSHLSQHGIDFEYFQAKTANDNTKFTDDQIAQYTPGQLGCLLSHYEILSTYKDSRILGIFEDDVQLCNDFLTRIDYIENNFNLDWDIFFLSSFYHLNDDQQRWNETGDYELTDIKYIHRVFGSFCTHSYLVNPKSIKKILKLIDKHIHRSYAIDHLYILIQPYINAYSFTPGIATQIPSFNDIDNIHKDQSVFEHVVGKHFFINELKDFDYDTYFNIINKTD